MSSCLKNNINNAGPIVRLCECLESYRLYIIDYAHTHARTHTRAHTHTHLLLLGSPCPKEHKTSPRAKAWGPVSEPSPFERVHGLARPTPDTLGWVAAGRRGYW